MFLKGVYRGKYVNAVPSSSAIFFPMFVEAKPLAIWPAPLAIGNTGTGAARYATSPTRSTFSSIPDMLLVNKSGFPN